MAEGATGLTDDGPPTDPASLVRWMDAMDAYRDKAVFNSAPDHDEDDGEVAKAIVVAWLPKERVQLAGGEPGEWGVVTQVKIEPTGIIYQVSWPRSKSWTEHYEFELEGAD